VVIPRLNGDPISSYNKLNDDREEFIESLPIEYKDMYDVSDFDDKYMTCDPATLLLVNKLLYIIQCMGKDLDLRFNGDMPYLTDGTHTIKWNYCDNCIVLDGAKYTPYYIPPSPVKGNHVYTLDHLRSLSSYIYEKKELRAVIDWIPDVVDIIYGYVNLF
jgi:hypothetical protein